MKEHVAVSMMRCGNRHEFCPFVLRSYLVHLSAVIRHLPRRGISNTHRRKVDESTSKFPAYFHNIILRQSSSRSFWFFFAMTRMNQKLTSLFTLIWWYQWVLNEIDGTFQVNGSTSDRNTTSNLSSHTVSTHCGSFFETNLQCFFCIKKIFSEYLLLFRKDLVSLGAASSA